MIQMELGLRIFACVYTHLCTFFNVLGGMSGKNCRIVEQYIVDENFKLIIETTSLCL